MPTRVGGGNTRRIGLDADDREQRQADVAYLLEQAMQRSLVGYPAMDDCGAVAPVIEVQPIKPGGPPGLEAPLEANLVSSGLVSIGVDPSAHLLPSPVFAIVAGGIPKLGADVVSGHRHKW
jgi:hypothetical protein